MAAEPAIQREMSPAQMGTSNQQVNALKRDPLSINSAKTKIIVDGATANGRTALALAIKSAASLAGTVIKTLWQTIAPTRTNRFQDKGAVHHQTVSEFIIISEKFADLKWA